MATIYRRCPRCESGGRLPEGVRTCPEHKTKGRWTGIVDVGLNGTRKRKSIGYHETRADAENAANELEKAKRDGTLVADTDMTLHQWLEVWLETSAAQRNKPTTLAGYASQVKLIGTHEIGSIKLQKVTPESLQRFYLWLTNERGTTATTAKRYHALIRRALSVAERRKLVTSNVAAQDEVFDLRIEPPEHIVWTQDQLMMYVNVAMGHRLGPWYRTAAYTGARRGEIAGMLWRDLDLDAKVWNVNRNLTTAGFGSLKTRRSRRTIDLDDGTIAILRTWRERQAQELNAAGIEPTDDLAVWTRPGTDIVIHVDRYTANHYRLLKETALPPMRLHGVRALHGSFLIEQGVPLHVVSRRLGHSTDAFTSQVYIRELDGQGSGAAEAFAEAMGTQLLAVG